MYTYDYINYANIQWIIFLYEIQFVTRTVLKYQPKNRIESSNVDIKTCVCINEVDVNIRTSNDFESYVM